MASDFTWTETPNDPSQPLAMGPFTTLHFTADKTIEHIVVDVGTGVEECAYRAGAFHGLYAGASTIDDTKTMVSLYRTGGWPAAPKVYPKVTETGTPTGWDVLLDFDFTAQPDGAQHNVPGDYTETIGGHTWVCHYAGNLNAAPFPSQVFGSGYRLAGNSHTANGNNGNGGYIAIDYTALAGYAAGRPACVLAVVSSTANVAALERALVGHFKPLAASQAQQSLVTASGIMGGYTPRTANSDCAPVLSAAGASDMPDPSTTYLATLGQTMANYVFGAVRHSGTYGEALFGPYDGSLPVVEQLKSCGGVDTSYGGGLTGLVAGVMWGASFAPGAGGHACFVERLIVLQAKE